MLFKILRKDIKRNKLITAILFLFVMLSALLVASGANIVMQMFGSMANLFEKSNAPHFLQAHVGEMDQKAIDNFVANNSLVKAQETGRMISIDASTLFLGDSKTSEENDVMDISFVKQNKKFDFLLNLKNEAVNVSAGGIAVPIYFMQKNKLSVGDKVRLSTGKFEKEFTITDFIRDVQMNTSISGSKRFVISDTDYETVSQNIEEAEYMIEFQLNDLSKLSQFVTSYQSSKLPQNGPNLDYSMLKLVNAIADGVVVVVILLVSILLILVAMLCLRFTLLTTIEEDYREIGVMKAIGIGASDIKQIYLTKYIAIAALASICGYIISIPVSKVFTANLLLYMGEAEKTVFMWMIPLAAVVLVFLGISAICRFILRRFDRISAVSALRSGSPAETPMGGKFLSLSKTKIIGVNLFIGLKDVLIRFKVFVLMIFIFIICTFIIIVPVNLLNTIDSPSFIAYLGAGRSDIRIDLRQTDQIEQRFTEMISYIKNDKDVEKSASFVTCKYKVKCSDGTFQNINIEIGNFTVFPLEYLYGSAPTAENEIALSYLNAEEFGVTVGGTLPVMVDNEYREVKVCGIYQDITNGGKSAKAILPYDNKPKVWYMVNLNLKQGVDITEKINEYSNAFQSAKVILIKDYVAQTLGEMAAQLHMITILAVIMSIAMLILITSLFLKMLMTKDMAQITILRSIGFSQNDIRIQYVTRSLAVLCIGIIVGTITANLLGQSLVGAAFASMGVSKIRFIIDPVQAYMLCPIVIIGVVTVTTLINTIAINKTSISKMNAD